MTQPVAGNQFFTSVVNNAAQIHTLNAAYLSASSSTFGSTDTHLLTVGVDPVDTMKSGLVDTSLTSTIGGNLLSVIDSSTGLPMVLPDTAHITYASFVRAEGSPGIVYGPGHVDLIISTADGVGQTVLATNITMQCLNQPLGGYVQEHIAFGVSELHFKEHGDPAIANFLSGGTIYVPVTPETVVAEAPRPYVMWDAGSATPPRSGIVRVNIRYRCRRSDL
jgi:hypothetical protein